MTMRIVVAAILSCTLLACSHMKETQKESSESTFNEQIVKYEASFRPSDYDPEPGRKSGTSPDQSTSEQPKTPEAQSSAGSEQVPGYRVQIFSLRDIDEARAKKTEIEGLFPGEWVYLDYESPAYKIRVGNFQNRFEADRFAKQLVDRGYTDAWTVPARVFKNPSPPPPNR
jgi:hypothetical protein